MKIAIVHHQYAKRGGGMESYLFDLLAGFARLGDTTTVFTYRVDKNAPRDQAQEIICDRLSWCPKFIRKFSFIHRINKQFNRTKFDLSLNLTRTASQDIAVCGGTHRGYLKHLGKKSNLKDYLEIYFEQKSFVQTPHIIVHSQLLKNEIVDLYNIDAKKVHLLHPPIDTVKFCHSLKARQKDLATRFNIDPHKTTLLFPSTGHKRKGWLELLSAMRMMPQDQIELLVVGKPISHNLPNKNIRYLGFVDNMAELYAAVDFTILPAHYEPFGLVAIESVQCGTPVIISAYVGAKDLLSESESIVLDQVTPENIVTAVEQARQKQFHIIPNFAETKGLTVDAHITNIKKICVLN
ncbi:Glycosyl transferase group 1 [Gammaproteobacteria bacterium]